MEFPEDTYKHVLDSLTAQIAVLDQDGVIVFVNRAWRAFGEQNNSHKDSVGVNYLTVSRQVIGEHSEGAEEVAAGISALLAGEKDEFTYEYPCPTPEAPNLWFLLSATPLQGGMPGAVVSHIEITERKQLEFANEEALRQVAILARTDVLTELLNRRAIKVQLEAELNHARRSKQPLSIFILDLDNLKAINDQHGHNIGDLALQSLARILTRHMRTYDFCGRLGGDEFLGILRETGFQDATKVAERIRVEASNIQVPVSENEVAQMTISVGVATFPFDKETDHLSIGEVINYADQALLRAKQAGKNRVESYSPRK